MYIQNKYIDQKQSFIIYLFLNNTKKSENKVIIIITPIGMVIGNVTTHQDHVITFVNLSNNKIKKISK
jgi:hypothetical protein